MKGISKIVGVIALVAIVGLAGIRHRGGDPTEQQVSISPDTE
jgi:hypothetical protein